MVSGNDDDANKLDGELGGNGGLGWLERVIPFAPTFPFLRFNLTHIRKNIDHEITDPFWILLLFS